MGKLKKKRRKKERKAAEKYDGSMIWEGKSFTGQMER